ncbi:TFIIB-type zinc ribbon-containing protein [Anaerotignum propionicum]|uniref:Uncharacterized protein n=1 Tax=Anaerotignum propionicum DSM 1682 TaxID=991789 RepID=A0A0X1U6X5_ANAPI|nr:TFIIB-type zinc ribbon-containing protein [Anaerotignum propionicum]AMJ40682.1 hypothetical protein CPRO_10870 [Anaerotignum propionicum DSM 1682]SHE90221.1 hypothetical protein SAMN02745151_02142 [[Clostridium] propionicum DSM 1682] [Anaerotignum propionicum DSM 1682]
MKIYSADARKVDYMNVEQNPYLGTIDFAPDLYEVFKLNGKYYSLGIVAANKEYGAANELRRFNVEKEKSYHENDITCPICGYVDYDSWEEDDENEEYQCGRCGAILEVTRNVQVTYSAKVKELPKIWE